MNVLLLQALEAQLWDVVSDLVQVRCGVPGVRFVMLRLMQAVSDRHQFNPRLLAKHPRPSLRSLAT